MNAILPLNIAALRVNSNDYSHITGKYQGKTGAFDNMPWQDPLNSYQNKASIGDKIFDPLGLTRDDKPLKTPGNQLQPGIHLHWELPDYFKKATQKDPGTGIVFPHAPNRWLITRFISLYDSGTGMYGVPSSHSWIIESDYVSATMPTDLRPVISVPLPSTPSPAVQPYMYMGRVLDPSDWNPATEVPTDFLPSYKGANEKDLFLTSTGFIGPYFSSYYPECCSVFGFWDNFSDLPDVQNAINGNAPIQFRASYQITGWLSDPATDPLAGITVAVTAQYDDYVARCLANNTKPASTPIDFFKKILKADYKWKFNEHDLSFTVTDHKITELNIPTLTLCAGLMQEVVWNMGANTGSSYFLASTGTNPAVWEAETSIAVGHSTEEALSALLKFDMCNHNNDPDLLKNYEWLLDALQLGLLKNLEKTPNKLIALQEAIHNNGFSALPGGYTWLAENELVKKNVPAVEADLPLDLAEQLYLLNTAQKAYDMGRGALITKRKQLFMDWISYIRLFTGDQAPSNISLQDMSNFIRTSSGGELNEVMNYGSEVGIIRYVTDAISGAISGIEQPGDSVLSTSLAYSLWTNYNTVLNALTVHNKKYPASKLVLQSTKAPDFYMPTEPVLLMEGNRMEPPQRNGEKSKTFVRLSPEILSQLTITYQNTPFDLPVSSLTGIPEPPANLPAAFQTDIQALISETFLLTPMLASFIAVALAIKKGTNNPAVLSPADFTQSMMYAAGGLSPLDLLPNPGGITASPDKGLFGLISGTGYKPTANPAITVSGPQSLNIVFTNAANNGWAPSGVGWNTQKVYPEFSAARNDPFYPIFMIWNITFNPLLWHDEANQIYSATNITDFFTLDTDGVDYLYKMNGGSAVPFASPSQVAYNDDATMRSGAEGVLTFQVATYLKNNPNDPEKTELQAVADLYGKRKFLSQAISGFNVNQVLTSYVAQVPVENLVSGNRDQTTEKLANAATATPNDNWYNTAFTSLEPIVSTLLAQDNFGPLRAGFLQIQRIEIVDVYGQRMDLITQATGPGNALGCITSAAMSPRADDIANQGQVYLSPRVLAPTRLWFEWLSARHNNKVPGVDADFVEMNSHPSTSPVTGWIMPNHLDNNLFFYNDNGRAIGTFGIEQSSVQSKLKYRTRAGNLANPNSHLAMDVGQQGSPIHGINLHIANFMWYMHSQDVTFFENMMTTLRVSENFINPSNSQQDASLSVLIGRPLALTRTVLGLETLGNLLPLSQSATTPDSPLAQDVSNQRTEYTDRMKTSSANLGAVNFPVRLGELANLDDGLVGYIVEAAGNDPYDQQPFYAPAADSQWQGHLKKPVETTIQLNLNQAPLFVTMLVDPRATVHATTGILAVNSLSIPPSQYSGIMGSLSVNFNTRPYLQMSKGIVVPLPAEDGYNWSWITPGAATETALKPNAGNETPSYGYTPQTIQEGWLALNPDLFKNLIKKENPS